VPYYADIILRILSIIGQIMIKEDALTHNCAVPTEPYCLLSSAFLNASP